MFAIFHRVITVAAVVAAMNIGAAYAGSVKRLSKSPPLTADAYASKIASINSCADLEARLSSIPSANPFLMKWIKKYWQGKGEFETTKEYYDRIKIDAHKSLGDPSRILVRQPLVTLPWEYDADTQVMAIGPLFTGYVKGSPKQLQAHVGFGQSLSSRRSYRAQNGYGAEVTVESGIFTEGSLAFPEEVFERRDTTYWRIKMSPSDAMLIKKSAQIIFYGNIVEPFIYSAIRSYTETYDSPLDGGSIEVEVFSEPKCILLASGSKVIYRFLTDEASRTTSPQ